jgi:hypothetical protein
VLRISNFYYFKLNVKNMRNFKILFGLLVVVFATFFTYSCTKDNSSDNNVNKDFATHNRSASISENCLSVLVSECTGELQIDTLNFNVEIYPGCYSNISWIEYLCLEPGTGEILNVSFLNVFGWPIVGQCDSTLTSWQNLFNTGQYAQYNADILAYQFAVEKAFTKKRMEELLSIGLWSCDEQGAYLQTKLFKASCQFIYNVECGVKQGEGNISKPYIGSCGESCCKSTIWWCTDKNGVPQPSEPLIEQLGSCEGPRIYPYFPKKGCTIWQEGVCNDRCNE